MESVCLGDKLATKNQSPVAHSAAHLRLKSAGCARLQLPQQNTVDRTQFCSEGVVWDLPFSPPRIAPLGDTASKRSRCGMHDVDLGGEEHEETLLRAVYGQTYESVSSVFEEGVPYAHAQPHCIATVSGTAKH
jgi:hypothetical protein